MELATTECQPLTDDEVASALGLDRPNAAPVHLRTLVRFAVDTSPGLAGVTPCYPSGGETEDEGG